MDDQLANRLRELGIDPTNFGDPATAWQRLHDRYGQRATLLDRYALEAASRRVTVEELEPAERDRLAREVLSVHLPGFEVVGGSDRVRRDPVRISAYDPAWPTHFAAWRERLSQALRDTAKRIDHVGSTAVPQLAAKPVIDVQISVPDVDDEGAYVPAIERLGVALRSREVGHRYFRPAGDRRRGVQIHVCPVGSEWERTHILFRDFLRTDAMTREAYAALKVELADRYRDDRIAYTEAKTSFILDAMERAERWATETGWRLPDSSAPRPGGGHQQP